MMLRIFAVILMSAFAQDAVSQAIEPERGAFFASKRWYQLDGDQKKGIFRSYGGLIIDDKLIDFPNLFLMQCSGGQSPYLTLHFPSNYVFNGFDSSTWLPKTQIAIRVPGGTRKMDAELNNHEFYVDLRAEEFDNFAEVWGSDQSVDFKFGPAFSGFSITFSEDRFDEPTRKMLRGSGKLIVAEHSFREMRTRCLAQNMSNQNGKRWVIFGSVECMNCDPNAGKTAEFFTMDAANGKPIRSQAVCESKRTDIVKELSSRSKGTVVIADLLCVQVP
ncbi:hypothetical protein [Rhizobium giardinii]|uniref:hypothetical protein n=1 Tax=Rhizobium giardinii TaxID=56731 RepID=UPI003D6DB00A